MSSLAATGAPSAWSSHVDGRIRLARPAYRFDASGWFPYKLLNAALAALNDGRAVHVMDRMSDTRALRELQSPKGEVDVVVAMPSLERESLLRVVPIPLYRGLFGWRVLVVRRGESGRFASVRSLGDLQKFLLLQGAEWPDTTILRGNGLKVRTAPRVDGLYALLSAGEGDAFPRAASEPWYEFRERGDALEVVPHLALHYRTDLFFYVRRDDVALATLLQRALELLYRNGGHDRLLAEHHREALAFVDLPRRQVLSLRNPLLPDTLAQLASWAWRLPKF